MALNASKIQGANRKRAPALAPGSYPARVVQILSFGLQKQRAFKGEEKPPANELYITYELLDEFMKDDDGNEILDKPRWISERFVLHPLSSDLATSTKRYYAIDPEVKVGGDWAELAGWPCMVTVANYKNKAEETRDKVSSVSSMRPKEAQKAPELVNPAKVFDIDDPDMEVFNSLPQWIQDTMTKENLEFGGSALEKALGGGSGKPRATVVEEDQVDNNEESGEEDW